jgi:hypothetical protein
MRLPPLKSAELRPLVFHASKISRSRSLGARPPPPPEPQPGVAKRIYSARLNVHLDTDGLTFFATTVDLLVNSLLKKS